MQAKFKMLALAGLISAAFVPMFASAGDAPGFASAQPGPIEAVAQQAWRDNMAQVATPSEGCYEATYPSVVWEQTTCRTITTPVHSAPHKYIQFGYKKNGQPETTGNGNDYSLESSSLITQIVGSFPTVTGVTSEKSVGVAAFGGGGILGANEYTLQINSSFDSTTSACKGKSGCTVWQQFIYSPDYETKGEAAVFMQYWLIGYGSSKCPSGFGTDDEGDCYENSAATVAPDVAATSLGSEKLTGAVVSGGNDTVTFTNGTKAYSSSGKDSVLYLATVWKDAEFNVVGNAGGSEAEFNSGSSVKVNVAATNGSTAAPTCEANSGSTGETNNLTLGSCTATGGTSPSISFTESN